MKRALLILLSTLLPLSCDREGAVLNLVMRVPPGMEVLEVIPGECKDHKDDNWWTLNVRKKEGVTFSYSEGILEVIVGRYDGCGHKFKSYAEVKQDTLVMHIDAVFLSNLPCLCYYTFPFRYTGDWRSYKYLVYWDKSIFYEGRITF